MSRGRYSRSTANSLSFDRPCRHLKFRQIFQALIPPYPARSPDIPDCKTNCLPTFSGAADTCNATQPTLSNAIAQLEAELGAKLFRRTTRSVELTPFGTYILPHVDAVLGARAELLKAAEAYLNPEHKILRIGLTPLADMGLLNDVLAPYRADQPDVTIYFKECLLDDLPDRLANGSVDFAVVPRDMVEPGWDHLAFYDDPLVYIPADGSLPDDGGSIGIADLPDTPVIVTGGGCGLNRSLEILFARTGSRFTTYPGAAVSYPVIEEWAGIGIGAGILPSAKIAASRHRARRLRVGDGTDACFSFLWVWIPGIAANPHVAAFHTHIRARVPSLISGRL